jgi:predicted 3-demethylubiquinone-9 3-methyltransferase (glyoxalase superfamily)
MMIQQKITPFLWFHDKAQEAAQFYTSVFKDSAIHNTTYYTAGAPLPEGSVMTVAFRLEGQEFVALNGGPAFTFSPAVSFVINCQNQEEIDYYWEKLSADPAREQCGWLQDKFGVSWQVVPVMLPQLLKGESQEQSKQIMQALLKMKKLVIADLIKAGEKQWTSIPT